MKIKKIYFFGGGGRVGGGVRMHVNEELKFFEEVRSGGGQGGCERRIEVFVKIQKKNIFFFFFLGGGGSGSGGWVGGSGKM